MNLDKHDLFRNAVPGFVFAIVVLSFYAVTQKFEDLSQNQVAIVTFIAGFPLGFIIHAIYRIIFHVWSKEQSNMEKEDSRTIQTVVGKREEKLDEEKGARVLSQLLQFTLLENPDNKFWKGRIDFQFSTIHSFGASALAIFISLLFMWLVKSREEVVFSHILKADIVTLIWGATILIFYFGRKQVKVSCKVSREIFAGIYRDKIKEYFPRCLEIIDKSAITKRTNVNMKKYDYIALGIVVLAFMGSIFGAMNQFGFSVGLENLWPKWKSINLALTYLKTNDKFHERIILQSDKDKRKSFDSLLEVIEKYFVALPSKQKIRGITNRQDEYKLSDGTILLADNVIHLALSENDFFRVGSYKVVKEKIMQERALVYSSISLFLLVLVFLLRLVRFANSGSA